MEEAKTLSANNAHFEKMIKEMVGSVNINDPKSNYYRVFKQLLLIEEHIAVKALNCRFCCFKHASTATALLDEITQLDGRCLYVSINTQLHGMLDGLPWKFTTNGGAGPTAEEYAVIGRDVRAARKYLMEMYFFPKNVNVYSHSTSTTSAPPTKQVVNSTSRWPISQLPPRQVRQF